MMIVLMIAIWAVSHFCIQICFYCLETRIGNLIKRLYPVQIRVINLNIHSTNHLFKHHMQSSTSWKFYCTDLYSNPTELRPLHYKSIDWSAQSNNFSIRQNPSTSANQSFLFSSSNYIRGPRLNSITKALTYSFILSNLLLNTNTQQS
jgi:hypothetical protein